MNHVALVGRLTKEPESRVTQSGTAVCTFTLAVDRRGKEKEADFIPVVLWGKTAEVAGKYLHKGNRCGIEGRIQVRSYEASDGTKRYATEVVGNSLEFLESKQQNQDSGAGQFGKQIPDEDIPW